MGFYIVVAYHTLVEPSIMDTLGPGKVSCIERCPHFSYIKRGVLISGVPFKRGSTVVLFLCSLAVDFSGY